MYIIKMIARHSNERAYYLLSWHDRNKRLWTRWREHALRIKTVYIAMCVADCTSKAEQRPVAVVTLADDHQIDPETGQLSIPDPE